MSEHPSAAHIVNGYRIGPYANLKFAVLSGMSLKNVDLEESDMSFARLRGSDLSGANLTGAKMPCPIGNLAGITLWGARIAGVRNPKKEHGDDHLTFSDRLPPFLKIKNVKKEIQKLLSTPPTTSDLSFSTFILRTLPSINKAKLSTKIDLSETQWMCGDDTTLALILIKSCPKEERVPDLAAACASENPQEWLHLWNMAKKEQRTTPLPSMAVVSQSGLKPPEFFARIFSRLTERNAHTLPSAQEQKPLPPRSCAGNLSELL